MRVRAAQVQADDLRGARRAADRRGACSPPTRIGRVRRTSCMLTEGLWRSQFGSDPSIVGRDGSARRNAATPSSASSSRSSLAGLPLDNVRRRSSVWVPLALAPADPQRARQPRAECARTFAPRRHRSHRRRRRSTRSRVGSCRAYPGQLRPRVRAHARAGAARSIRRRAGPRFWCCCWRSAPSC